MSVVLQATAKQTASLIFLHGLGDTGHGWSSVFSEIKKPHIKYIFPTAPVRPITLNGGFPMNAWFDIRGLKPDVAQDEEGIKSSAQLLLGLVQQEMAAGIPSERIFVGGFSQGGATALYAALTCGLRFAGIVALSTWLPLHHRFPAQLKQAPGLAQTPILQCHGDADPMVSLAWSQLSVQFVRAMGFSDLRFKVYPGLSHSSCEDEIDNISDFIKGIAPN